MAAGWRRRWGRRRRPMSVVVVNDGFGDGVRYYLIERLSIYDQVAVDLDRSIKTCGALG
jgi:hypothetical protein